MIQKTAVSFALYALAATITQTALAETPPPLSAYGDLPAIEEAAISQSGDSLAVVSRMDGGRSLTVFDAQHKQRAKVPIGEIKLRDLQWVGDGQVLLLHSATIPMGSRFTTSKHEFFSASVIPVKGGQAYTVFGGRASLLPAVFGRYGSRLIGGKWQAYFGGLELRKSQTTGSHVSSFGFDNGRPALFSVDIETNTPRKVAPSAPQNHARDWLVDSAGEVAVTLDLDFSTGAWRIFNRQDVVLASGTAPSGDVSLISFDQTGSNLIYEVEDKATGNTELFEVPLAGGQPKTALEGIAVARLYVDPTNARLLGYISRDGDGEPVLFDPAQQKVMRKVYRAFPKLHLQVQAWTPNFSHVLVRASGNRNSGAWYLIEMAQMKAFPIDDERREIGPDQVGPISTVSYTAADGTALDGILTLPPGKEAKNLPVIVLPHGGPHAHDVAEFDWWAQAFASRGYAVFQPNFRGSTNRDDAFRRAGYGQWGRKMQTDLSDGLAELVRQGVADPKRACIVGASYGGYAALAGVTLQRGLYRCAVAVAPVSDLTDMYWTEYRESGDNPMVQQELRESLGSPSRFAEVSPRRRAAEADAPILLIHGKDDTVVPLKQSTAMADALKDKGKPYELVVLNGEDHWLSRGATRQQMLEAAMSFVQKNNPAN